MFTFPVGMMNKSGGVVDPYLANVVLYLKGDGDNDSTNIIDSSPNPKTITRNSITISTAQNKYGGSSLYSGSNNQNNRLSIANSSDFNFAVNEDFTMEFWLYRDFTPSAGTGVDGILSNMDAGGTSGIILGYFPDNQNFWYKFNSVTSTSTFALELNTWIHIAAVQVGNNSLKVYKNGIVGVTLSPQSFSNTNSLSIFNTVGETRSFRGYIDSLRITKGIARYTTNFNPETDTYLAY